MNRAAVRARMPLSPAGWTDAPAPGPRGPTPVRMISMLRQDAIMAEPTDVLEDHHAVAHKMLDVVEDHARL